MAWLRSRSFQLRKLIAACVSLVVAMSLAESGEGGGGGDPPRLRLDLSELSVSAPPTPSPTPAATQEKLITVNSSEPNCPTRQFLVRWQDHRLSVDWNEGISQLAFSQQADTADFEIIPQDQPGCPTFAELQVTSSNIFNDLPWGSAQGSFGVVATQQNQHHVPFSSDQPTLLTWYLQDGHGKFDLVVHPSTQHEPVTTELKPLLGVWWRAEAGQVLDPATSQAYQDCHSVGSLFWPQGYTPCRSSLEAQYAFGRNRPQMLSTVTADSPRPGEVLLTEINWAGSFTTTENMSHDEWLELSNTTPETLNLKGVEITNTRAAGAALPILEDMFIPPYGQVVISRSIGEKTILKHPPDLQYPLISLGNAAANIKLLLNGQELDRTPSGAWQDGKNQITPQIRASAQRRTMNLTNPDSWLYWRTCPQDDLTSTLWCKTLTPLNLQLNAIDTWVTPWQASPW